MAESQKLELSCGICSKQVNKPKQLPCCHTFCRHCLEEYVRDTLNTETQTIDCPKCQKLILIPENGTKGLPSNYYILAQMLPETCNVESGDLTCDIQGCKSTKAVGYCFECGKNLCLDDKEKHKTVPLTRSHHILTLVNRNVDQGKMEKMSYCEKHTDNILKFYCRVCAVPICSDCKLAKHENHMTEDIDEVAMRDRERLSRLLEILRQYLPCMNDSVNAAENAEAAFKNHANDTIECINHRRDEVKRYIDVLCDGAVNYVRGKLTAELQCMVPQLNDIKEDRNFIERSINTTEPILNMGEDVKIVQVTKDVQDIVNNLPAPKQIDEKKFIFNAGVFGRKTLCKYVGTIGFEAKKIKQESSFDMNYLLIYSILPVSESTAYISMFNSQESVLYKVSNGKEEDRISLHPYGQYRAVFIGEEEFLLSSKRDKKLKIWKDHKESDFAETPYEPRGLCITDENNVLVCCSSVERDENDEPKGAILMYSKRGELLQKVDSSTDGKNRLFHSPRYICVNINGDICVSDQGGKAVLIFNSDFKLLTRYEGSQPFRPRGICCDRFGRIIVTDGEHNKIHLLTHSGEFIRYLLTEEDGVRGPMLATLGPGNKLWIACRSTGIHVYTYLDAAGLISRPTSPKCVA